MANRFIKSKTKIIHYPIQYVVIHQSNHHWEALQWEALQTSTTTWKIFGINTYILILVPPIILDRWLIIWVNCLLVSSYFIFLIHFFVSLHFLVKGFHLTSAENPVIQQHNIINLVLVSSPGTTPTRSLATSEQHKSNCKENEGKEYRAGTEHGLCTAALMGGEWIPVTTVYHLIPGVNHTTTSCQSTGQVSIL